MDDAEEAYKNESKRSVKKVQDTNKDVGVFDWDWMLFVIDDDRLLCIFMIASPN